VGKLAVPCQDSLYHADNGLAADWSTFYFRKTLDRQMVRTSFPGVFSFIDSFDRQNNDLEMPALPQAFLSIARKNRGRFGLQLPKLRHAKIRRLESQRPSPLEQISGKSYSNKKSIAITKSR
jgi:hypothetical protein